MLSDLEVNFDYFMLLIYADTAKKNALGRAAFTTDIWSNQTMESFMAITAHFIAISDANIMSLETRLVAFRGIKGAHTGENLAEEFFTVLNEIKCVNKVCI